MLTSRLPEALRAIGFTDSQIVFTLRDGGPLDYIRHRTWCETCHYSIEAPLRDLLENDAICKCGGFFHVGDNSRDMVDDISGRLVLSFYAQRATADRPVDRTR